MKFVVKNFSGLLLLSLCLFGSAAAQTVKDNKIKPTPFPREAAGEIMPAAAEAALAKGKNFLGQFLYAEAIIEFDQAIRLAPKFAEAYLERAIAHGQIGEPELAGKDALEAIKLNPKMPRAYNVLGKALEEKKDYKQAIAIYGKAIELDKDYIAAYNNRGFVYAAMNMFAEAIADFTEIIRLDPQNAYAYFENRGIVYGLKKDYAQSVEDFSQTLQLKPKRVKTYRLRASAYRKLGKIDLAVADEQKAKELADN